METPCQAVCIFSPTERLQIDNYRLLRAHIYPAKSEALDKLYIISFSPHIRVRWNRYHLTDEVCGPKEVNCLPKLTWKWLEMLGFEWRHLTSELACELPAWDNSLQVPSQPSTLNFHQEAVAFLFHNIFPSLLRPNFYMTWAMDMFTLTISKYIHYFSNTFPLSLYFCQLSQEKINISQRRAWMIKCIGGDLEVGLAIPCTFRFVTFRKHIFYINFLSFQVHRFKEAWHDLLMSVSQQEYFPFPPLSTMICTNPFEEQWRSLLFY